MNIKVTKVQTHFIKVQQVSMRSKSSIIIDENWKCYIRGKSKFHGELIQEVGCIIDKSFHLIQFDHKPNTIQPRPTCPVDSSSAS